MRRCAPVAFLLLLLMLSAAKAGAQRSHPAGANPPWLDPYREPAARLIGEAVGTTFAWQRLSVLTDTIGNRLSGSPALDRADLCPATKAPAAHTHPMTRSSIRSNRGGRITFFIRRIDSQSNP